MVRGGEGGGKEYLESDVISYDRRKILERTRVCISKLGKRRKSRR